jgi:hypothetical protein
VTAPEVIPTPSTPTDIQEQEHPMLEVHAPQEALHTWRGFLIHIAAIVVGLVLAVGLEQSVEFFHHRHQSEQLEGQMREVFAADLQTNARNFQQLGALRAYLVEMRAAIVARLDGKSQAVTPASADARMATFPIFPSMAPYDAAKANGAIVFLPTERIRIYNRVALTRELTVTVRDSLFDGLRALGEFHERYVDSAGSLEMGEVVAGPDLARLSRSELTEYLSLIAALIKKTDLFTARLRLFDRECHVILGGVRSEDELVRRIIPAPISEGDSATTSPLHN